MSLVTRCPACSTTFRVVPAQLSARGGRVRCGKCSAVFDGVNNLLTDEVAAAVPLEPSPQLGLFEARDTRPTSAMGTAPASPAADPDDRIRHDEQEIPLPPVGPVAQPALSVVRTESAEAGIQREKIVIPAFLEPEPPHAGYAVAWGLLALIALAALLLQAALLFRTEIAVLLPQARAHLVAACDMLGCDMRLPKRVELLSIESSDLQADSQRPGGIVLNALLRNRAPFALEYPDLELTLTDAKEQAVIRRVLKPGDYLQDKRDAIAAGMGGGTEESVRMFLDTGGLLATGYQLFLFYPCPPLPALAYWQLSYPSRCQNPGPK